jgi:hypothetical protein
MVQPPTAETVERYSAVEPVTVAPDGNALVSDDADDEKPPTPPHTGIRALLDDVHYLSDVVFVSASGMIAGRTVTEHGRETWTLAPAIESGGGAVFIVWTP